MSPQSHPLSLAVPPEPTDHLQGSENQAHLKDKDLYRYAAELGMDMARYTAEMDDHIYLQKVREHIEGGRLSHIRATPTFFVDGAVQDISFGMKSRHDAVASAVGRGS
jgi:protein-disulfide isomerase